jgi:hypothetical protein
VRDAMNRLPPPAAPLEVDERTPEQRAEDQALEEELTAALIQVLTEAQRKH